MPTTINTLVKSVEVVTLPGTDIQQATLVLRYTGTEDLESQIIENEELSIELPSHAPPPQP